MSRDPLKKHRQGPLAEGAGTAAPEVPSVSGPIHHVSPERNPTTAPYNFVPLPVKVLFADELTASSPMTEPWKHHHEFLEGHHNGWIDLDIETLTPLFTRGPRRRTGGGWDRPEARLRPAPYTLPDGRPAIPGSSLRGMVRNLFEILTFSKLQPVTRQKLFYRSVGIDRLGRHYRKIFVQGSGRVQGAASLAPSRGQNQSRLFIRAGFVRFQGKKRMILECGFARVSHRLLERFSGTDSVYEPIGLTEFPSWRVQHHKVCVVLEGGGNGHRSAGVSNSRVRQARSIQREKIPGSLEATVVVSGKMESKRREFVFLHDETGATIEIPDDLWDRFHDPDQITGWQQKAFPRDKPFPNARAADGHLRDGEPIFFLCDPVEVSPENPSGLRFFGRAQMFRFPYPLSPRDLLPEDHREARLDLTEALFGRVGTEAGEKVDAIKGRLRFEDAVIATADPQDCFEDEIVPEILSAPNPTSYQLYLTQNSNAETQGLTTYFENDVTTLRGHKLYWHRWEESEGLEQVRALRGQDPQEYKRLLEDVRSETPKDTQHTLIQPVKAKQHFKGKIRFDNLTDVELGALLSALDLPETCAHKLGMGKPLGLGSVRVSPTVHLVDRKARYTSWLADGTKDEDTGAVVETFTAAILEHARKSGEAILSDKTGLRSIARLDALFHLLEWKDRRPPSETRQMKLKQFEDRDVLPGPHAVAGSPEPAWTGKVPTAVDPPKTANGRSDRPSRGTAPSSLPLPSEEPKARPAEAKPVQAGQDRDGLLVRAGGGGWGVEIEGENRIAQIENPSSLPESSKEGQGVKVYVREASKKKYWVRVDGFL